MLCARISTNDSRTLQIVYDTLYCEYAVRRPCILIGSLSYGRRAEPWQLALLQNEHRSQVWRKGIDHVSVSRDILADSGLHNLSYLIQKDFMKQRACNTPVSDKANLRGGLSSLSETYRGWTWSWSSEA